MFSVIKGRFVGWWGVLACRTWFLQMNLDVSSQKTPYWSCQKTGPRGAANSAGHGISQVRRPHGDFSRRFTCADSRACIDISQPLWLAFCPHRGSSRDFNAPIRRVGNGCSVQQEGAYDVIS